MSLSVLTPADILLFLAFFCFSHCVICSCTWQPMGTPIHPSGKCAYSSCLGRMELPGSTLQFLSSGMPPLALFLSPHSLRGGDV